MVPEDVDIVIKPHRAVVIAEHVRLKSLVIDNNGGNLWYTCMHPPPSHALDVFIFFVVAGASYIIHSKHSRDIFGNLKVRVFTTSTIGSLMNVLGLCIYVLDRKA